MQVTTAIASGPRSATGVRILQRWRGIEIHYVSPRILIASRGYDFLAKVPDEQQWRHLTRIPAAASSRVVSYSYGAMRLLRRGVRSFLPISDDRFVFFCDRKVYYWEAGLAEPKLIGVVEHGSGPLKQGCCTDSNGTCYYGEYSGSRERTAVRVLRWSPEYDDWQPYYTFQAGSIRHIHALQFDPYTGKLWIATGDRDEENLIGYFEPSANGPELRVIATGGQFARAVSLIFTPDYVYWGTDAGRDTSETRNSIYRWSRRGAVLAKVADVSGPVFYSAQDECGRLYLSTVVEGSVSEVDDCAHLWMCADGETWHDVARWTRDWYPRFRGMPVFGTANLSFPAGLMPANRLYVAGHAVEGSPCTWLMEAR